MAITTSYSAIIRGTTYTEGMKFVCTNPVTYYYTSEGVNIVGTMQAGTEYKFCFAASGESVVYPYCIGTANYINSVVSGGEILGWVTEEAFPDNTTETYTITYYGSVSEDVTLGGTIPDTQTKTAGVDITLSTEYPTRDGYEFKGWRALNNEIKIGDFQPGDTYTHDCRTQMYAIWGANITYHPNEINGLTVDNMPANTSKMLREPFKVQNVIPTMEGYRFIGWALSEENADATTPVIEYAVEDIVAGTAEYNEDVPVDLYAVWTIAYDEPTISDLKIVRCDSTGNESNVGTYAKVSFNFTIDENLTFKSGVIDYGISSVVLEETDITDGSVSKVIQDTFDIIKEYNVSVTIVDSDGIETSASTILPAIEYKKPEIIINSVVRANSDGSLNEEGTYCLITFAVSVDEIEGTNSITDVYVDYREHNSGYDYQRVKDWTEEEVITQNNYSVLVENIDTSRSYDFAITARDRVSFAEAYRIITYTFETMNFLSGGHGVAIGKKSTEEDLFDVAMNTRFRGSVTFDAETNMDYQGISANKAVINDSLTVAGRKYGDNVVLWEGCLHMDWDEGPILLNDRISNQPNGIVLIFSGYDTTNNVAIDRSINTFFVSKFSVERFPWTVKDGDGGHAFIMMPNAGFSKLAAKYLYFTDTKIYGHEGNARNDAQHNIVYDNRNYVLRYVIGV